MELDLINELNRMNLQLTASIKKLAENGRALAQAEKDYKIKLYEEVLRLKDKNTPATLINLLIYGVREVAELRFKRDIAETLYNTNLEHINATKLQLRLLENQISREWGSAK